MKLKELYRRYRTWQKTPAQKWNNGTAGQCCPNCGHEFTGNYCPVCGQQSGDGHITWRWVWRSILDVWGMDSKALPRTVLQLFLRPGYLIGDYIDGHRQVCYKPVNMLFIVAVLYVIVAQLSGHSTDTQMIYVTHENNFDWINSVFVWFSAHPAWAAMSLTLIMILPTYFLFRFAPRHTRHTLPESVVIQLFMSTLMLICALASDFVLKLTLLIPFYYYLAYRQLFGYRPWGTLWRLMVSALVWFFMLVIIVTVPLVFVSVASDEGHSVSFDLSIFNLDNSNAVIPFALAMIVLMLLVTAAPVAIGYWISKKTARLQNPETK